MRRTVVVACVLMLLAACKDEKSPPADKPETKAAANRELSAMMTRIQGMEDRLEEVASSAPPEAGDDPVMTARLRRLEERISIIETRLADKKTPRKKATEVKKAKPIKPVKAPEKKLAETIDKKPEIKPETPDVPEEVAAAAIDSAAPPLPDLTEKKPGTPPVVELVNIKIARDIDRPKRKAIDPGDTFEASIGRLYCWLALANPSDEAQKAVAIWKHKGKERSRIELTIGPRASHWRTWAYTQIQPGHKGDWIVEIRDFNDALLGSTAFKIE